MPNHLKAKNKYILLLLAHRGTMEFEKAKQILNNEKVNKYTDKEINEIIKTLNVFAEVWISNVLKTKKK